jgi:pyruvate formate lyase activating enzyme
MFPVKTADCADKRHRGVEALRVAGLVPFTTIDFPGRLAAVAFFQGCPWRCGYCHNPELVSGTVADDALTWHDLEQFMRRRVGQLEGIVFSGGEPLLQPSLAEAAGILGDMGFAVGLHTGGSYPEQLACLLPSLDWVGLDIKALPNRYSDIVGTRRHIENVWTSLDLLLAWDGEWECRTTVVWQQMSLSELRALGHLLAEKGVRHYALQCARLGTCLNDRLRNHHNTAPEGFRALCRELSELFDTFEVRGDAY